MERMTFEERQEAVAVALAETTNPGVTHGAAELFIDAVERIAMRLHKLYEAECNRPLTSGERADIDIAEQRLRDMFSVHGLGLFLNSDPRGNPVGIKTPKTGRYNTMGGAEGGWRL